MTRLRALFHRGLHGGLFGFTKGFAHFNDGFQFVEFGRSVGNGIQPAPRAALDHDIGNSASIGRHGSPPEKRVIKQLPLYF